MKLAERKGKYQPIPYYSEVEEDLMQFQPDIRVLPAPFFNEPNLMFTFRKRHEPGEKGWSDGGYELRGPDGELRAFDLDQVIVHPSLVKRKVSLNIETGEVEQKAVKPKSDKGRGRPSLDPEERQRRVDARLAQKPKSVTGKRGRPAMDPELKAQKEAKPKTTGGKRGRPTTLTNEERERREKERLEKQAKAELDRALGKSVRGRKPKAK
jgi:hypothetical protein